MKLDGDYVLLGGRCCLQGRGFGEEQYTTVYVWFDCQDKQQVSVEADSVLKGTSIVGQSNPSNLDCLHGHQVCE
jgi:hypothetical protein